MFFFAASSSLSLDWEADSLPYALLIWKVQCGTKLSAFEIHKDYINIFLGNSLKMLANPMENGGVGLCLCSSANIILMSYSLCLLCSTFKPVQIDGYLFPVLNLITTSFLGSKILVQLFSTWTCNSQDSPDSVRMRKDFEQQRHFPRQFLCTTQYLYNISTYSKLK